MTEGVGEQGKAPPGVGVSPSVSKARQTQAHSSSVTGP